MCGIFGQFVPRDAPDQSLRLRGALSAIQHRGPDDRALETIDFPGGRLSLGHVRLSIIDLSAGGHQPMQSSDGRYLIAYNGEIYNYRELRLELRALGHYFQTDSDTEVLLAAWAEWGLGSLRRFVGMFAFAILDRVEESLTLVRDAFGIKPLFYAYELGDLQFASELEALLALRTSKPKLNPQRAYDYLMHGVQDSGFDTFIQGVHHLPPAHWLRLNLRQPGQVHTERWWNPSLAQTCTMSFEQAAEQLRELFLDSVRLHLRSDVPLGIALSGGIDSSAIACCVRHLEPHMDLHTFSYIAADEQISEEVWVDKVNEHIRAQVHKVRVERSELQRDIHTLVQLQGEPFCTTSMYAQYRVFGAAREAGVKVVLEGQGGDELLAGYHGYQGQRMRSLWETGQWASMYRFAEQWKKWPGRGKLSPWRALAGQILPNGLYDLASRLHGSRRAPAWLDTVGLLTLGIRTEPHRLGRAKAARGRRVVEVLFRAMSEGGLPSLLRYGDRNAMHYSIENRVPFLTLPLAEYIFTLPEDYLISQTGETKSVFRAAMRGLVPDALLDRRDKLGFETPMGQLMALLVDKVLVDNSYETQYSPVNPQRARGHFTLLRMQPDLITEQDWRLLNIELWAQTRLQHSKSISVG